MKWMKIVETYQIYGAKDVSDEVSIENDEAELKYLTVRQTISGVTAAVCVECDIDLWISNA